jgi:stringent starvation protein B
MPEISTKPYLVRALFDWCNDSGYTPYVAVAVGEGVVVPAEYVKDGEIVLNVSPLATNRLSIGNEWLEFQARFGGVAREVRVPIESIRAIYARETGQGMAFEAPARAGAESAPALGAAPEQAADDSKARSAPAPYAVQPPAAGDSPPEPPPSAPAPGDRPRLTRVK